jgi:lipopolysaccharide/colanic/teichoic acid biosynthesis glycosyltransferase
MVKRLFDVFFATLAILMLAPVFLVAAIAIRITSPGPVLYQARRTGRGGSDFVMYKFRTMHVVQKSHSVITGTHDARVFPVGRILRATKIDELPQLFNVLIGQMSIVGPRPEDPVIVAKHYGPLGNETLTVRPGLASYGSLYNYTHGQLLLDDSDPEKSYIDQLLPIKLALEVVYVRHRSLTADVCIIMRTMFTIVGIASGKRRFAEPSEIEEARQLLKSVSPDGTGSTTASRIPDPEREKNASGRRY